MLNLRRHIHQKLTLSSLLMLWLFSLAPCSSAPANKSQAVIFDLFLILFFFQMKSSLTLANYERSLQGVEMKLSVD